MTYRIAAIFAGFASAVALVAGFAGGVPFAAVLVRALLGAVAFGALGAAAAVVLERFVPELLARPARAPERSPEEPPAPSIDIVLPEESPLGGGLDRGLEPAAEAAGTDMTGGADPLEALAADSTESGQAPGELAASPVEALGPDAAGGQAGEDVEALPSLDGLDVAAAESASAGAAAPRPAAGAGADPRTDPSLAAQALRTWLKRDHEG